jgi:hypothetical protein
MNYDFNTKEEFRDFILDSLQSGRYNEEIQNMRKGRDTIWTHTKEKAYPSWEWMKLRKLYLVKDKNGNFYFMYRISDKEKLKHGIGIVWYVALYRELIQGKFKEERKRIPNMLANKIIITPDDWTRLYILLESDSSGFINWKKNPLGVK